MAFSFARSTGSSSFHTSATPLSPQTRQHTLLSQADSPQTANKKIMTSKHTLTVPSNKHESARRWLQKQLRKTTSRQGLRCNPDDENTQEHTVVAQPCTAPASGTRPANSFASSPPAPLPINVVPASPPASPPPRPARPDSGVIRDVNVWLDASMVISSPPLMGGLSYWRAAGVWGVANSPYVQHAIPLPNARDIAKPSTSHSHGAKSFRRRARRIYVEMSPLSRVLSQRSQCQTRDRRKSVSMPLLTVPLNQPLACVQPRLSPQSSNLLHPSTTNAITSGCREHHGLPLSQPLSEHLFMRYGTPIATKIGDTEGNFERRVNASFVRPGNRVESTRPSTAAARVHREDSMGDISDAPTYFSGLSPPSYRSRAPSIITTSSFGCIDGMDTVQREISRQQAAQRRGMRGRLKDFARTLAK